MQDVAARLLNTAMRLMGRVARSVLLLAMLAAAGCSGRFKGQVRQIDQSFAMSRFDEGMPALLSLIREKRGKQVVADMMNRYGPMYCDYKLGEGMRLRDEARYDDALGNLNQIVEFNAAIVGLPPKALQRLTFELRDVGELIGGVRNIAAEDYYARGIELEKAQQFKEAAIAFKTSNRFVPNFSNALAKYEVNRASGTIRILVLPFTNGTGDPAYQGVGELLAEMICQYMRGNDQFSEYCVYLTWPEIVRSTRSQGIAVSNPNDQQQLLQACGAAQIKHLVRGAVLKCSQFFPDVSTTDFVRSTRVTQTSPMSSVPISVLVTATVSEHTRSGAAATSCSYELVSADDFHVQKHGMHEASRTPSYRWGTYIGDVRALTDADRELCARPAAELEPPDVFLRNCTLDLCMKLCGEVGLFLR